MKIGRGYGLPSWVTGFIGLCPKCKIADRLIIELKDAKGTYYNCIICQEDFEKVDRIQ